LGNIRRGLLVALSLLALTVLSVWYFYQRVQNQAERRYLYGMDTLIEIVLYGPHGAEAVDRMEARLREWEANTSMYQASGDVGRLNHNAGEEEPVSLGEDVFYLLERTKELSLASEGIFDPTIAPLTLLWNVRDPDAHVPSAEEIGAARALVDVTDLWLDPATFSAKLMRPGQAVDLGGIAKGAASVIAFEVMEEYGIQNGYVSLGGNLAVKGRHPDGSDFVFGIRNPWGEEAEFFATLSIPGRTMATAGDYIRYFEEGDTRYAHLLDPRTGYPAESELTSVSVISADGAFADFLSTTLFIAGKEKALSLLNEEAFEVVAVDREKNVYASASLEGKLLPNPDEPDFQFYFLR
jgi:thiamine biosynthesis lipoprotein